MNRESPRQKRRRYSWIILALSQSLVDNTTRPSGSTAFLRNGRRRSARGGRPLRRSQGGRAANGRAPPRLAARLDETPRSACENRPVWTRGPVVHAVLAERPSPVKHVGPSTCAFLVAPGQGPRKPTCTTAGPVQLAPNPHAKRAVSSRRSLRSLQPIGTVAGKTRVNQPLVMTEPISSRRMPQLEDLHRCRV